MIISIKPWLERTNRGQREGHSLSDYYRSLEQVALSSDAELEMLQFEDWAEHSSADSPVMSERKNFYHRPVMAQELLQAMRPVKGKQIFDGTLGGGGHAELFLQHGGHVIGCDRDEDALRYAGERLGKFGDCFLPVRGNFREIGQLLADQGIDKVDGVLADLGVSSHQLDEAERGFSFRFDAPLDMRMDQRQERSAKDLVNELEEAELADLIWKYGEERRSRRIAKAVAAARKKAPIETTAELAEVVESAVPRTGPTHPATRTFQAIRIAVNEELESLEAFLEKSVEVLAPGGVLAVITFHSLEDRIVKHFLRDRSAPLLDRPEWPEPRPNPGHCLSLKSRRAIVPTEEEVNQNPRARSAKLRVATKI